MSGEGVTRSLAYAGLLRSRPLQVRVCRGDGDGGDAGVRRRAADGQGAGCGDIAA